MDRTPIDYLVAPPATTREKRLIRRAGWTFILLRATWINPASKFFTAFFPFWHFFTDGLSGEFFLRYRANGGSVITLRAAWIAVWLFLLSVLSVHFLDRGLYYGWYALSWELIQYQAWERVTWFGAFLGAAYAGLYARFASQWTYVAGVYNQIKAAEARGEGDIKAIAQWKAGYIEDAEDLHLATKPPLANTILIWLEDPEVRRAFIKDAPGRGARLYCLIPVLKKARDRHVVKYRRRRLVAKLVATKLRPTPSRE